MPYADNAAHCSFKRGVDQESDSKPVRISGYSKQRANLIGEKYSALQYNSKDSYRYIHANRQLLVCVCACVFSYTTKLIQHQ